jgi:hypothetical protein
MRRLLIVLTILAIAAPVLAHPAAQERSQQQRREQQRSSNQREQVDRQTRTFNLGADGELDVSNIAGDIVITRAGGPAATIEIIKTARGADPQDLLSLVTVDVAERGNRVEVRTRYPEADELRRRNRRNIHVEVRYVIAAPQNTRIIARSISGHVGVRDISGPLTLESVSGSVTIANAGRVVNAKSISGDVEAVDTRIDGTFAGGTISGAVRLRRTTARNATLNSVSGDVVLEDVVCERVEAQTVSGQVLFSGELSPNGHYELGSHSGNVRVAVGAKTGFQVEATSFSGSIDTQLPLTLKGQGPGRRSLRGAYGDGSATLELTSFSGNVAITKR